MASLAALACRAASECLAPQQSILHIIVYLELLHSAINGHGQTIRGPVHVCDDSCCSDAGPLEPLHWRQNP